MISRVPWHPVVSRLQLIQQCWSLANRHEGDGEVDDDGNPESSIEKSERSPKRCPGMPWDGPPVKSLALNALNAQHRYFPHNPSSTK